MLVTVLRSRTRMPLPPEMSRAEPGLHDDGDPGAACDSQYR